MTDEDQGQILPILRDIQTRLGRMEVRLSNLELRMNAQEQHLIALMIGHPAKAERVDPVARRAERSERRTDRADPA